MRTTELLFAQHIGRGFKHHWIRQGRRKVPDTGVKDILAVKGIQVVDPSEILSSPFTKKHEGVVFDLPPKLMEEKEVEWKTRPCYIFHDKYSPPAGIAQIQHLTNCIVRSSLHDSLLNHIRENSVDEDDRVKEAILHANLLDSHQEKLPRMLDVINKPGWKDPIEYGMPVRRKNKTLTYQLLLLLDQLFPKATTRYLVENAKLQVLLENSGSLFKMQQEAACILSSTTPLSPLLSIEEVSSLDEETLPEIYPFSPFLYCNLQHSYSEEEYYGVATRNLYPHTIFIHLNMPRMKQTEDSFYGITLLKAFSHATAYAKQWCKIENGMLEKPLVVQIVHTNGQKFHIGVLQLNSLDLNGTTKNVFWSHPWETLFEACSFKGAEPNLEGYNPKVWSLLKALHLQ